MTESVNRVQRYRDLERKIENAGDENLAGLLDVLDLIWIAMTDEERVKVDPFYKRSPD